MKKILTDEQRNSYIHSHSRGDFNTPVSVTSRINRPNKPKTNKNNNRVENVNIINQLDLIGIYRILCTIPTEQILFSINIDQNVSLEDHLP